MAHANQAQSAEVVDSTCPPFAPFVRSLRDDPLRVAHEELLDDFVAERLEQRAQFRDRVDAALDVRVVPS